MQTRPEKHDLESGRKMAITPREVQHKHKMTSQHKMHPSLSLFLQTSMTQLSRTSAQVEGWLLLRAHFNLLIHSTGWLQDPQFLGRVSIFLISGFIFFGGSITVFDDKPQLWNSGITNSKPELILKNPTLQLPWEISVQGPKFYHRWLLQIPCSKTCINTLEKLKTL